jgi:hypothetical protein
MKLRKLVFLVGVAALLLSGGIAVTQTYTRAIQFSQDLTGPFLVDTNFGVYFPAHVLSTGTNRPAPTITGIGSPTISGTDFSATITGGTSATQVSVLFGQAYVSTPNCVVSFATSAATPLSYTPATTGLTINYTSSTGPKIYYVCPSLL